MNYANKDNSNLKFLKNSCVDIIFNDNINKLKQIKNN